MITAEEILNNRKIPIHHNSGNDHVVHCWSGTHVDNSPSLRVDQSSGIYHCFSCGFAGNLYSEEGLTLDLQHQKVQELQRTIKRILNRDEEYVQAKLDLEFILTDGFYRGLPVEYLKQQGMFGAVHNDNSVWVVYTVRNFSNHVSGYIQRRAFSDASPKVMNYPAKMELPLTPRVRPINKTIILVEAVWDMLTLHYLGYTNTVTTLGTSFLNVKNWKKRKENISRLKPLGAERIVLMYDGDRAGRDAMESGREWLEQEFVVETIYLPEGKDPNSMKHEHLEQLLE